MSKLNVLHLVGSEMTKGAAKGAYGLHSLLDEGLISSQILTPSKLVPDDSRVKTIRDEQTENIFIGLRARIDNAPLKLYSQRDNRAFSSSIIGYDFTKTKYYKEADILHLHWINGGFTNIKHLSKVNIPIVWTLRDMWPLTGGCHYSLSCTKYKVGCGTCDLLKSKKENDLSRFVVNRKLKFYPKNITIVGSSEWITEAARNSLVFRNFEIRTIHNAINLEDFYPENKDELRRSFGLSGNKKIILTGSHPLYLKYKGFQYFLDALDHLDPEKYLILTMGKYDAKEVINAKGFEYVHLGFVKSKDDLRKTYSLADCFVMSSEMDASPKAPMESMACGTPVVCFDLSGPKEIVDHKINGYGAKPFDCEDLAKGIRWITQNSDPIKMAKASRSKIMDKFDLKRLAVEYQNLYLEILGRARSKEDKFLLKK